MSLNEDFSRTFWWLASLSETIMLVPKIGKFAKKRHLLLVHVSGRSKVIKTCVSAEKPLKLSEGDK